MSLTFKRVTQISKRRCRSESKSHSGFLSGYLEAADQVNVDVDEFPPLRKTVEAAGLSICDTDHSRRELCTSGFEEQFSNPNSLDLIENTSFEEGRWNVYKERNPHRVNRSKFCCQKNRNVYCPQMSMTPIYEKSLSSILEQNSGPTNQSAIIGSRLNNQWNQCFSSSGMQFNFAPSVPTRQASDLEKCVSPVPSNSSTISPLTIRKGTGSLNISQKSADLFQTADFKKPPITPGLETLKSNSAVIVNRPIFQNDFASQNRMPTLQSPNEITDKTCSSEVRPVKAKSIHTMNESTRELQHNQNTRSFSTYSHLTDPTTTSYFSQQTPGQKIPLLSNTTWFLQDNISNQFGFNSILNGVSPVFQQGNLYAECYDFPTVPPDAFHIIMPVGTPVLPKKKEFEHMFSPYRRETCALRRRRKSSMLD